MEASEQRRVLYEELQNSGIANQIKAKMRREILQELKKRHEDAVQSTRRQSNGKLRVVDQMVAQYFQRHGYHYSLSIYAAESGMENSKALTPMETLRVLGLNGWPKFVQIVSNSLAQNPGEGLLVVLLESMASFLNSVPDSNSRTQEARRRKPDQSDSYLKRLEENYSDAIKSFQEEVLVVKKDNDKQIEAEVQQRMNEFRSKEIEDLKAQEEVYWRRQMQYHKENLDESFQKRVAALREKEQYLIESVNRQKTELEHKREEQKQRTLQQEMLLRSKHNEMERAFSERQTHVSRLESHLNEREQKLVQIEHELQQKLIGWANKEKHYEAQAHLHVQQSLILEQEELTQWRIKLQEDWTQLEQDKGQFVKEKEGHQQKWLAMEMDLKMSEEKAFQLKENEEVLIQQVQRLKNELLEFQAMFLKSHNVPLNKTLTTCSGGQGGRVDRVHIVRELIAQMTTCQDQVKEWKRRFKSEKLSHKETKNELKCILQEDKAWKQKCKCIEEVAKEAIQETERSVRNWSESTRRLRSFQQERLNMQTKIQKLQEELEATKTNERGLNGSTNQPPLVDTSEDTSCLVCRGTSLGIDSQISALLSEVNTSEGPGLDQWDFLGPKELPMTRVEQSMGYRELEKEEEQVQCRLRRFKERMQSLITHVSPIHKTSGSRQHQNRVRRSKRRQLFEEEDPEVSSEGNQSDSSSTASLGLSFSDSEHSSSSSKATSITGQELALPVECKGDVFAKEHEFSNTVESNARQLLQIMQSEPKTVSGENDEPTIAPSSPASANDRSISLSPSTMKETPAQELNTPLKENTAIPDLPIHVQPAVPPSSLPSCVPILDSNFPGLNPFPVECGAQNGMKTVQTDTPGSTVFMCSSQDTSIGVSVPTLPIPDHFANLFSTSSSAMPPTETTAPVPVFTSPFSAPATTEVQTPNPTPEPIQEVEHQVPQVRPQEDQAPQSESDSLPTSNYDDDFEDLNELEIESIEKRVISDSLEEEQSPVVEVDDSIPISNPIDEEQGTDSSLPDELEGFSDTSF